MGEWKLRPIASLGGRTGQPARDGYCLVRRQSGGTCRKVGNFDNTNCLYRYSRSNRTWFGREPRPGGNLTGAGILTTELLPKRFELLSNLVPKADVFGLLVNPDTRTSADEESVIRAAAAAHGKPLISIKVNHESGIGPAFDTFTEKNCAALMVSVDPNFMLRRETVIALARQHRIPTMYGWPEFPREGGLASYGPDLAEQYRLSGVYVGRILKGERFKTFRSCSRPSSISCPISRL